MRILLCLSSHSTSLTGDVVYPLRLFVTPTAARMEGAQIFQAAAEQAASCIAAGQDPGAALLAALIPGMAEDGYRPLPHAETAILHFAPKGKVEPQVCPGLCRLANSADVAWALTHPRADLPSDGWGILCDGAVVAAAWMQNGEVAVETAPSCRRRGYARACAAALFRDAMLRGETPIYRCSARNAASRALAASLGLMQIACEYYPGFRRESPEEIPCRK